MLMKSMIGVDAFSAFFYCLTLPYCGVLFSLFGLSKHLLHPFAQRKRQFCLSPQAFYLYFPQNIVPLQRVVAAARLSDCRPVSWWFARCFTAMATKVS